MCAKKITGRWDIITTLWPGTWVGLVVRVQYPGQLMDVALVRRSWANPPLPLPLVTNHSHCRATDGATPHYSLSPSSIRGQPGVTVSHTEIEHWDTDTLTQGVAVWHTADTQRLEDAAADQMDLGHQVWVAFITRNQLLLVPDHWCWCVCGWDWCWFNGCTLVLTVNADLSDALINTEIKSKCKLIHIVTRSHINCIYM